MFLQGGAALRAGEAPPLRHPEGSAPGWLERVDTVSLETISRSVDLASGGWLWCGGVVVHANGDLYMVNGRFCHRLDASCVVVAERELPLDSPYNGLQILSDGNLVTRNLGFRADDRAGFIVLEPEGLRTVRELEIAERCMARFSCDRSADGTTCTSRRRQRCAGWSTGRSAWIWTQIGPPATRFGRPVRRLGHHDR